MSEPITLDAKGYRKELRRLQVELVRLQYWIQRHQRRVAVLFEGRDAAGKGGVIRRITRYTNPRIVRVIALPKPTEVERGQWYFQRYVAHLPECGEIALFDRSWYNRAGVEPVMGFCTDQEVEEFFVSCPQFEEMLIRSGIHLIKYWFTVSPDEQERRFQARSEDPLKQWKLSPMDIEARDRWMDYTEARDRMFARCHTSQAPWHVIDGDCKKSVRLNCLHHLLEQFDYQDITPPKVTLRPRPKSDRDWKEELPGQLAPVYRVVD